METKKKQTAENYIKEIRSKTRRIFTSEQKILIVMEALRAETSVAELCRKYAIQESTFHKSHHAFVTTVTLLNGVPFESASKMLRHTNIQKTQLR